MGNAPPKRVVGRPFEKGFDPRRIGNGRKKGSMTQHLRELLDAARDPDSPKTRRELMLENIMDIACTGDGAEAVAAAKLLWSYDEGQPVARNENAGAGEFEQLDDVPTETIRHALLRVK